MDARAAGDTGVDIRTAARALGLSVAATRKRILRGSLDAYKVDGRWRVVLPVSHTAGGNSGHDSGEVTRAVDTSAARVVELEAEVQRLWQLVEAQQMTILHLSERPAIAAPASPPPTPAEAASERRWWQIWRRT